MTAKIIWPEQEAFLDIAMIEQVSDGRSRCTAVAICDAEGNPTRSFYQGQAAHFFYEFEVLDNIGVPCGGLEFHNADGLVIHGKNCFQCDAELPLTAEPGQRLRYHQIIHLDVTPGCYWASLGLSSTDEASYRGYATGAIGHELFAPREVGHCRLVDVASFMVRFDEQGKLRHHGAANLSGDIQSSVVTDNLLVTHWKAGSRWLNCMLSECVPDLVKHRKREGVEAKKPTIIHVTHWKAGSQWLNCILRECVPKLIVKPKLDQSQFFILPIQPGKVYPTVYATKKQFDHVHLPPNSHRFVVVRDLRDTLVSAYFSMKISHPTVGVKLDTLREKLNSLNQEEGMLYMLKEWLPPCAHIQSTWLEAGEPLIRYEDMLEHDLEILEPLLLDRCQLPVERERFREVVLAHRFKNVTKGRARGNEDVQAHERKGIAGDWQNHFTDRIKEAFKNRYGDLLVATGYARDLNW